MINKLTPEQEAKIPEYVEKYIKLGLSTYQTTLEEVIPIVNKIYECGGLKPPKQVILVDSPLQISKVAGKKVLPGSMIYGSQDANWLAYYQFWRKEAGLAGLDSLEGLHQALGVFSFAYPCEHVCIVSKNPVAVHMRNGRLHNEHGKAVEYADGFGCYSLNGIPMEEWMVTTPKAEIDKKRVLGITNTEQRMALIKHIGLAEFIEAFNPKVLDTEGDYRLLLLKVEGVQVGPYLEMRCPSTGRPYLEGVGEPVGKDGSERNVDTSIKTVEQALAFRFKKASAGLFKGSRLNLKNIEVKA